jgi:hypothetical protein
MRLNTLQLIVYFNLSAKSNQYSIFPEKPRDSETRCSQIFYRFTHSKIIRNLLQLYDRT